MSAPLLRSPSAKAQTRAAHNLFERAGQICSGVNAAASNLVKFPEAMREVMPLSTRSAEHQLGV